MYSSSTGLKHSLGVQSYKHLLLLSLIIALWL